MTNKSKGDLYRTIVFDCDGVILNSNAVKTNAFYKVALPYGAVYAKALVDYHVANGGVSRYQKFQHFLQNIIPQDFPKTSAPNLSELLDNYSLNVSSGLLNCEQSEGLQELRKKYPNARWLVASGGDQEELRQLFAQRGLDELFDGGIFGSPDDKHEILKREIKKKNIQPPALLLGDSVYDYEAAIAAGIDFIFISKWSEVLDWESWVKLHGIKQAESLSSLTAEHLEF